MRTVELLSCAPVKEDGTRVVARGKQPDVGWLDVAVAELDAVHVLQTQEQSLSDRPQHGLREPRLALEHLGQSSAAQQPAVIRKP